MSEETPIESEGKAEIEVTETENVESEVSAEQETTEPSEGEKVAPEEEKVVYTQKAFADKIARVEAKATRKAKRLLDAEYQQKQEATAQQQQQQQTPQSIVAINQASPGTDYVMDPLLNCYIHKNTTAEQKLALINNAVLEASGQQQYQQPVQPQMQTQQVEQAQAPVNVVQKPIASERLIDQLEDFVEEHPDLEGVLKQVDVKIDMLENAALYKDGIKALYEEAKSNPSKIFAISSLSDEKERNLKMFELNSSRKDTSKKVTKVTSQPEPISGGSSIGLKPASQMSESELREKYIRELK